MSGEREGLMLRTSRSWRYSFPVCESRRGDNEKKSGIKNSERDGEERRNGTRAGTNDDESRKKGMEKVRGKK